MAFDLALGQTKEDWSRDGHNGGRPSPGGDAIAGALLIGLGAAIAMVKGPQPRSQPSDNGDNGNDYGNDYNDLHGRHEPARFGDDERITSEIPTFEPMSEVVGRRLR